MDKKVAELLDKFEERFLDTREKLWSWILLYAIAWALISKWYGGFF